jgi:hypothetical protein
MTFIRRPNPWICLAAFAAGFWVTLRVVAAPAVPQPTKALTKALAEVAEEGASAADVRDPALERMISRFAREALVSEPQARNQP